MNYELLRPFDLEAAKAGAKITDMGMIEHTFAAEAGPDGDMAVRDPEGDIFVMRLSEARMVPLAWIEGKPVYPRDVLYRNTPSLLGARTVVSGTAEGIADHLGNWNGIAHLTWTPPKVKKEGWINLYSKPGSSLGWVLSGGAVYDKKDRADRVSLSGRIACVRIEWEE